MDQDPSLTTRRIHCVSYPKITLVWPLTQLCSSNGYLVLDKNKKNPLLVLFLSQNTSSLTTSPTLKLYWPIIWVPHNAASDDCWIWLMISIDAPTAFIQLILMFCLLWLRLWHQSSENICLLLLQLVVLMLNFIQKSIIVKYPLGPSAPSSSALNFLFTILFSADGYHIR